MSSASRTPEIAHPSVTGYLAGNRLLQALAPEDRRFVEPFLELVHLGRGEVLVEPGDDVVQTYFPIPGAMISLVVELSSGQTVEAATVGREGALGGIVSAGHKPAFARAVVQVAGAALRLETDRLEEAKERSPRLRDLFARYADALLAQVLQSVACNALHPIEARCSRWLLSTQDRVGGDEIVLTQEFLADMLGVHRTTVNGVASALQEQGLIRYSRGRIAILDRPRLKQLSCECYSAVERHFARVLPEVRVAKPGRPAGI